MLYLLTGHVQCGKTTALQGLCAKFQAEGRSVYGVVSPGIFDAEGRKVAVNARLYPSAETFLVGQKEANFSGPCCGNRIPWDFDEAAVGAVNNLFEAYDGLADVLVIDELGPLEINNNGGFLAPLDLLKQGPTACAPITIAVVRHRLLEPLKSLLADAWTEDEIKVVTPASLEAEITFQ
ncbi:MAG: nucleoside-triphosphatase [Phoenicibacter congonensis]|uniref:Nucleoside-triphosphatase n=1 Tax=Phoenicibacter congonensis TaxID=1944646 RepID=A0AA43RL68_9ACTN|nr:nucleoside-triphosphatase [Phoenicibacter congonensis]